MLLIRREMRRLIDQKGFTEKKRDNFYISYVIIKKKKDMDATKVGAVQQLQNYTCLLIH